MLNGLVNYSNNDEVLKFYDRNGKEISFDKHNQKLFDDDYTRVMDDRIGDWIVQSMWHGHGHNYTKDGKPLIYEVLVTCNGAIAFHKEVATCREAIQEHRQFVENIREGKIVEDNLL